MAYDVLEPAGYEVLEPSGYEVLEPEVKPVPSQASYPAWPSYNVGVTHGPSMEEVTRRELTNPELRPSTASWWDTFRMTPFARKLFGEPELEREYRDKLGLGHDPGLTQLTIENPTFALGPGAETKAGKAILGYFVGKSLSEQPERLESIRRKLAAGDTYGAMQEIKQEASSVAMTLAGAHGLHEGAGRPFESRPRAAARLISEGVEASEGQGLLQPPPLPQNAPQPTQAPEKPLEITPDVAQDLINELTKGQIVKEPAKPAEPAPVTKPELPGYEVLKPATEVTPQPDWRVSVLAPTEFKNNAGETKLSPGFVQLSVPNATTEATQSPSVESLRASGVDVPDFSKLPTGTYTYAEATAKVNEPLNPGGALKDLPPDLQAKSNSVKDQMRAEFEKLKAQQPVEQPLGMGGARAGETGEPGNPDVYGVAARVRAERAKAGQVADVPTGEGISAPDSVEHGRELLNSGSDPNQALADFERTKAVSSDAMALVRAKGEYLAQRARTIEEQFGTNSPEYQKAWKDLSDWDSRTKPMQTEWHKIGQAQQGETDLDTGTFTGLQRAYKADTGKDFTPSQATTAQKLSGDVKAATAATATAKTKLYGELEALAAASKTVRESAARMAKESSEIPVRENATKDADEAAIAAAHKAVREAANRMAEAETKVAVANEMRRIAGQKSLKSAEAEALKSADATVRKAAVLSAAKERQKLVEQANREKEAAEIERKAAQKALDAANKTVREAAARRSKQEQKELADPGIKVWEKVREYLDKGEDGFDDIRNKVATDLGMTVRKVTDILTTDKKAKQAADDLWRKQQNLRRFQQKAKRWLRSTQMPTYQRALEAIPKALFSLKVGFHGTVALGTHAPTVAFQPKFWRMYVTDFLKMYHMVGSPKYYEMQVQDLLRRQNYTTARRAGLVNDPSSYEDFNSPDVAQFAGRLSGMGNRGYAVLKILRQDMFDQHWDQLPKTAKIPEVAKAIADGVNHATGVVKVAAPKGSNVALFAPRLWASRVAWLITDPAKAADTFARWKESTPGQREFAVSQIKEKAWVAGTLFSLLALNQGFLSAIGSKQQINITDPLKSDWLKFKMGGMDISYGNAMLSLLRLPFRLFEIRSGQGKKGYADENTYTVLGEYARSQLSPFMSLVTDLWMKSDWQNRPLPNSNKPVPARLAAKGFEPYTWPEFIIEKLLPIPAEEAMRDVWHHGLGMKPDQVSHMFKAMATIAFMSATGGRLSDDIPSDEHSPARQVYELVDTFKQERHIPPSMGQEDSVYSPITHALQHDDHDTAKAALAAALNSVKGDGEKRTAEDIANYYEQYQTRPFTGSKELDFKFYETLTPAQRKIYDQAVQDRIKVAEKVGTLLSE